jgi:hypothetical protein
MTEPTTAENAPPTGAVVPVPIPVPNPAAENPRKHPVYEHAESIGKLATVVVGVLYVLGLLISNIQLMELGISDFGSLQPRNVLTGFFFLFYMLFVFFLVMPIAIVFGAMRSIRDAKTMALPAKMFFFAVAGALGLFMILPVIFGEGVIIGYLYAWGSPFGSGSWRDVFWQFVSAFWHQKVWWAGYFIVLFCLPFVLVWRVEPKPQPETPEGGGPESGTAAGDHDKPRKLPAKHFHMVWGLPERTRKRLRGFLLVTGALVVICGLPFMLFDYADEIYPNVKYNLGGGQPQVAELVLTGKTSDLAESAAAWAPATRLCCDGGNVEQTIRTGPVAIWYQSDKFIYASSLGNVPGKAQIIAADLKLVRNIRYQPKYVQVESGARIVQIYRQDEAGAVVPIRPPPPAAAASAKPALVWTQLHPDDEAGEGQLIARAVVEDGGACPALRFDAPAQFKDKSWPMAERWAAADGPFPVKVCELAYPGFATARIGGTVLKPRPADPQKIVVIGDTGCRIADWGAQDCNTTDTWAFRKIAAQTAALQPDLVIHVGDYLYREAACGKDDAGKCGGSPHGDNWPTWTADFFAPAGALLTAAPWVMLRGNHEDMERAGAGWRLLLAPFPRAPIEAPWPDDGPSYALRFERLTLAVLDVANAANAYLPQRREEKYARWMDGLAWQAPAARDTWLVMHNPAWVTYACKTPDCRQADEPDDPVRAVRERLRRGWPMFDLMLAGHTHMFQLFVPADRSVPPQVVAGMGGTLLERKSDFPDAVLDKPVDTTLFDVAGKLWLHHGFGYMVLARKDKDAEWSAALHDPDGKLLLTCNLAKAALDAAQSAFPCAPPP